MAIYPIKVSLEGGELVYTPDVCVVDSDPEKRPNYIIFFLDKKLSAVNSTGLKHEFSYFKWDDPSSAARVFEAAEIVKGKKQVILLEDSGADNNGNPEYWSYEIHILKTPKTGKSTHCKKSRNGKNPIIINK